MAIVPSTTRFIGISPSVNLTERKSSTINAETEPYTMQDIVDTAATVQATNASSSFSWTSGFFNLVNGIDNRIPFDSNLIANANFLLVNSGTNSAGVQVLTSGVYQINTHMHFFDIGNAMRFETKLFIGQFEPLVFNKVFQNNIYDNGSTNQVIDGTTLIELSAGDIVGIVVTPSDNAPYPCDLGNLTPTLEIIKIS